MDDKEIEKLNAEIETIKNQPIGGYIDIDYLNELNQFIDIQIRNTSYGTYTKQYVDSLQKEIELLKQKQSLLESVKLDLMKKYFKTEDFL